MKAILAGLGAIGGVAGLSYLASKKDGSESRGEAMSKRAVEEIDPAIRMTMRRLAALPLVDRTVFSCAAVGPKPNDPDERAHLKDPNRGDPYVLVCFDGTKDWKPLAKALELASERSGDAWDWIHDVPVEGELEIADDVALTDRMARMGRDDAYEHYKAGVERFLSELPRPTRHSRPLTASQAKNLCKVYYGDMLAAKEFWERVESIVRRYSPKGSPLPALVNDEPTALESGRVVRRRKPAPF